MYMIDINELEKKVRKGIDCHVALRCKDCPYYNINGICDDNMCFDVIRLFDYYAHTFAKLDTVYRACRDERNDLQKKYDKVQIELDALSYMCDVMDELFGEEE